MLYYENEKFVKHTSTMKKNLPGRQVLQESNTQYPISPHNNKKKAMLKVTDNSSICIPPLSKKYHIDKGRIRPTCKHYLKIFRTFRERYAL